MVSQLEHIHDAPGRALARGVGRLLRRLDHAVLTEFAPKRGLRVDLISMAPDGEIWIIECKSSRADFTGDRKWHGYLEWCDRYLWAVGNEFPNELLPEDHGLILADSYGAELLRTGSVQRLPGTRRNKMIRVFARTAALRLHEKLDPGVINGAVF